MVRPVQCSSNLADPTKGRQALRFIKPALFAASGLPGVTGRLGIDTASIRRVDYADAPKAWLEANRGLNDSLPLGNDRKTQKNRYPMGVHSADLVTDFVITAIVLVLFFFGAVIVLYFQIKRTAPPPKDRNAPRPKSVPPTGPVVSRPVPAVSGPVAVEAAPGAAEAAQSAPAPPPPAKADKPEPLDASESGSNSDKKPKGDGHNSDDYEYSTSQDS
jgi:hypothetical protein